MSCGENSYTNVRIAYRQEKKLLVALARRNHQQENRDTVRINSNIRISPIRVVADDGELVGTHMGEIHQQHLDDIASILARFDRGEVDKATVRRTINSL